MISVFRTSCAGFLVFVSSVFFSVTSVFAGEAVLSWAANAAPDLAGYVLYYKDNSNSLPLTKTQFTQKTVLPANLINYTKTGLTEGTHRFALTAFDASANESGLSVVVQKVISSSVLAETTPGQEKTNAGGGGCGMVFPRTGSKPPGPGDATILLLLVITGSMLLIKKTVQTNRSRHRFTLTWRNSD